MSQTLSGILTSLAGQAISLGLAAFFWQYIQEHLKKINDVDRRIYRLEVRDELRKELGIDKADDFPIPAPNEPRKM